MASVESTKNFLRYVLRFVTVGEYSIGDSNDPDILVREKSFECRLGVW